MTPDNHNWIAILYTFIAQISFACSLLHTFLPPWDFLNDFPTVQKIYKAFIYVIGYMAGNGRSTVYPGLSTSNGTKTSRVVDDKGAINADDSNTQNQNIPPTN